MTHLSTLRSAVCFAALVSGSTAFAEISAQQVWEDWKTDVTLFGGDITTTSEEMSGDSLVVRGLTFTSSDDEVSSVMTIDTVTFAEQDDGSVTVTSSDSYPVVFTSVTGTVVTVQISHPGFELNVSGTPEALDYTMSSDSITIALQDIVENGETFTGDVQLVANDLSGSYATRVGDMRNTTYDLAFGSMDVLVDIVPPSAATDYVTVGGRINGVTIQGEMTTPRDAAAIDPDTMFADGMAVAGGYSTDSSEFVFDINADGAQTAGSFTAGAGSLTGQISNETVSYITKSTQLATTFTTSDFPAPIDLSLAEYGVTFEMPVGETDTPQPFALGLDLVDLSLSDAIWALFDAGNVLPRDPATVQIGFSGMARPLFDLLDPAQEDAMMASDMPFELVSLALTKLNIALAGATATGEGSFTFDNNDLQTFAPFPRPEGQVSVQINGLNALLDNLVTMGLIPADQMMGPRMMMGMFARSTGNDQLETNLEVTADGQVLANGQRIR